MDHTELSSSTVGNQDDLRIARAISWILPPFIVAPLVFVYLALNHTQSIWFGWLVWFVTFLATNVVIGLYVSSMKRRGTTSSIDVPERLKRRRPFMVGVIGYVAATVILLIIDAPDVVTVLMAIYAVNTTLATVINQWWKISIHGMSVGGTLVPFLYLYGGYWWLLVLAYPLMIYSRVKLRAHTLAQVVAGIAMAFILTWIQLYILL